MLGDFPPGCAPDALVLAYVGQTGVQRANAMRHSGQIGMKSNRHHAPGRFAFPIQHIELPTNHFPKIRGRLVHALESYLVVDFVTVRDGYNRTAILELHPIGRDQEYLKQVLNYLLKTPDGTSEPPSQPVVLDPNWERAPWANLPQSDQPAGWTERAKPVLIVLPVAPKSLSEILGSWLAEHVAQNRNMVRFLLPKSDLPNFYSDRNLLITARCALLASEWKENDQQYSKLHTKFEGALKAELKTRFDRYALLKTWDFQTPKDCAFYEEAHGVKKRRSGTPHLISLNTPKYHRESQRIVNFVPTSSHWRELGRGPASAPIHNIKLTAARHRQDVRRKIADLRAIEANLGTRIRQCEAGALTECPMIEALSRPRQP